MILGSRVPIFYPDRSTPYMGVVQAFCNNEPEGDMLTEKLLVSYWYFFSREKNSSPLVQGQVAQNSFSN
jgi:hypothetical protein